MTRRKPLPFIIERSRWQRGHVFFKIVHETPWLLKLDSVDSSVLGYRNGDLVVSAHAMLSYEIRESVQVDVSPSRVQEY